MSQRSQNGILLRNIYEFYDYLKITKPKEEYLCLFKEIFIGVYKETINDFEGDYLRKVKEIEQMKEEKKNIVKQGAKKLIPELTLMETLSDYEKNIKLAENSLTEFHHEEVELDPLLNKAFRVIRTHEDSWYEAPPKNKPQLQRLIYPFGVSYNYPAFSNSKISFAFALINDLAAASSNHVSHPRLELGTNSLRGRRSTS